jgi:hypothetical protein
MTTLDPSRPGGLARLAAGLAGFYRRMADRVDPAGAPRTSTLSFTIEPGIGIVVRDDGRGCRLGWPGGTFDRAHADAGQPLAGDTVVWLPRLAGRRWPPDGYTPVPDPPLMSWITTEGHAGNLSAVVLHNGTTD